MGRSILGLVIAAAIIGLIAFARGEPDGGRDGAGRPAPELRLTV